MRRKSNFFQFSFYNLFLPFLTFLLNDDDDEEEDEKRREQDNSEKTLAERKEPKLAN